jgi:hypothetical protein
VPRTMPNLTGNLQAEVNRALALAEAGETVRAHLHANSQLNREITVQRLQLIYEMAFLHIFVHWEVFLEESFVRYLCGYAGPLGPQVLVQGTFERTITSARLRLLGGQQYILWHSAQGVQSRGQKYFVGGLHENVVASGRPRLEWFAAVRHYIAHKNSDARLKFDQACMSLCGRRYPGSRPGAFLRTVAVTTSGPPQRWLEIIGQELARLAGQIVP